MPIHPHTYSSDLYYSSDVLDKRVTLNLTFEEDSTDKLQTDKMDINISKPMLHNNKTYFAISTMGKNAGHVTLVLKGLQGEDNSTELK